MDAARVVVLGDNSASGSLDSKRIARSVPADNENVAHCPGVLQAGLVFKLCMTLGEAHDIVNLLAAEMTAPAVQKKPAEVIRDGAKGGLELSKLLLSCRCSS